MTLNPIRPRAAFPDEWARSAYRRLGRLPLLLITSGIALVLGPGASGSPITWTSTVPQSGVNTIIGNGPLPVTGAGGYNFTGQNYAALASITTISVTMTLFDGDSAMGNLDFNKLTLALDGIDTGIHLNGFRDGATDTLTTTGTPQPSAVAPLVAALRSDGRLAGGIASTDHPSNNQISVLSNFTTMLTITGEVISASNWSILLDSSSLSAALGGRLTYSGSIVNNTGTDLLLTSAFINLQSPIVRRADYSDAFLDTLGIIPAGGYAGPLFYVDLADSVSSGSMAAGSFELGAASPATPDLVAAPFQIAVTAVPEPGAWALVAGGLMMLVLRFVRTSRSSGVRAWRRTGRAEGR